MSDPTRDMGCSAQLQAQPPTPTLKSLASPLLEFPVFYLHIFILW